MNNAKLIISSEKLGEPVLDSEKYHCHDILDSVHLNRNYQHLLILYN